jgi:dipeptidyl aminopeptidase/acylaminoacyl peptidase
MGCFGDIALGEQVFGCNSADVIPADLPFDLQTAYHKTASDAEALKDVAAFYHVDHVTAPLQIHYGTEDGQIYSGTPPEWSLKLTNGLRDAGRQVELYQYEGEGHSFVGEPWFIFMRRVLHFFDEIMK